jgi:hypothetical protein
VTTSLRRLATICAGLALAAVPLAGAMSAAQMSPDQQWVFELRSSRASNQVAFTQLKPGTISPDEVSKAKFEVSGALAHLKKAVQVAPQTIGASDAEIAASVGEAQTLSAQASKYLSSRKYATARKTVDLAMDATDDALRKFGIPLASDFRVIASFRDLAKVQSWEAYVGLTAKAPGVAISKIVVGLAGRETANASEPGGLRRAPSMPITNLAIYTLQEPSGVYSSGWGKLVNGIIVCNLNPVMDKDETFAISFQPRVPAGTKFLVKMWSADRKRSYAVVTTK